MLWTWNRAQRVLDVHFQAVSDYLTIFDAAGQYIYLKSAYFYVQEMGELQNTHRDVHTASY